jgi:hypothetical protein
MCAIETIGASAEEKLGKVIVGFGGTVPTTWASRPTSHGCAVM